MTPDTTRSYSEFGTSLQRATGGARVPLNGSFELTFRCNLRCIHCYIPDYSGAGEMRTDEVKRILSEAADEGCLWMLLTGGEVLSRGDFPEIYLHARRLGMLLTVFTNGILLDDRIADLFTEYPPFGLEITLYGMSDATYLTTTGFPGRFTRVRSAVEKVVQRGLRLTLKAVAMEALRSEIPAMQAWAASLGVPFRFDSIIHGRLDGSMQPTGARATPENVVAWDERDPKRRADWMTFYRKFVKPVRPSEMLMSCGAGVQSFHVDPKGTLLSCEALPLDGYDLRRGTFREGWHGIVGDVRRRRASAANVCASCALRPMCDRCPASATLETGDPDGWIPYYCEITHRRAAMFERELGDPEVAARYQAHAEKVASGWTPPGVTLPRATSLAARPSAGGCGSSGGCASSGGCSTGARPAQEKVATAPLQITLRKTPTSSGEAVTNMEARD
jgi:radical SAM protein with 4Fe4S-binding SPASM domain